MIKTKVDKVRVGGWLAVVLLIVAVTGCQEQSKPSSATQPAGVADMPREFLQADWPAQEVPVAHIIRRDYRMREGDQLEIIYHVRHQKTEAYRIQIQDVIAIRFPFNASLDQAEQVQPDGKLYLALVGPVEVLGKTVDQVQKILENKYAEFIKEPVITVSFKQSNVKIAELKEAIKTAPRGQSRLVPITPDGTISLPFIVDVRAAGLTISELHRSLNKAYQDIGLEELEVTVNVQEVSPLTVYVLGEVQIPGVLLNKTGAVTARSEMTLLQAISQAGSYLPARAELSQVMLVRRRHLPRPEIAIINVYQLLENRKQVDKNSPVVADDSKYRYDIWLEDGDVVYVPTSEIAHRADYVNVVWAQTIRNVPGFGSSATAGYSYTTIR